MIEEIIVYHRPGPARWTHHAAGVRGFPRASGE